MSKKPLSLLLAPLLAVNLNTALLSVVAVSSAVVITACSSKAPQQQAIAKGSLVIALGDSLTYGYGATPEQAYPKLLTDLTG
ncbi:MULTISPECIES: hypothetical protein [unclassified Acinetobacter]|uniref:hypothetical protein n=1 Tax=unclassified Acinetobacter TaxID=196816 RepID=UPI0035B8EA5A